MEPTEVEQPISQPTSAHGNPCNPEREVEALQPDTAVEGTPLHTTQPGFTEEPQPPERAVEATTAADGGRTILITGAKDHMRESGASILEGQAGERAPGGASGGAEDQPMEEPEETGSPEEAEEHHQPEDIDEDTPTDEQVLENKTLIQVPRNQRARRKRDQGKDKPQNKREFWNCHRMTDQYASFCPQPRRR